MCLPHLVLRLLLTIDKLVLCNILYDQHINATESVMFSILVVFKSWKRFYLLYLQLVCVPAVLLLLLFCLDCSYQNLVLVVSCVFSWFWYSLLMPADYRQAKCFPDGSIIAAGCCTLTVTACDSSLF